MDSCNEAEIERCLNLYAMSVTEPFWNIVGGRNLRLLQIYNQNSFNPARLKQSIPITMTVAPAKDAHPIIP